jgi:(1->4)-alpha-D-glucan 1-alpha-D-glucosylmutase
MVDPDNRRPVDFAARAQALTKNPDWHALAQAWTDGRVKLALCAGLLRLRLDLPKVFAEGDYRALSATGPNRNEIIAFARSHGGEAVIVIAARLFARSTGGGRRWPAAHEWAATVSVEGFSALQPLLSGQRTLRGPHLAVADVFDVIPVAILRARETSRSN